MYYLGEEELKALEQLFSRKKLFRYSAQHETECDLFEKEFSNHISVNHSILLSSGTNAIIAALKALDIKPGDEVLIPTYTFVATATAVLNVGAIPVLVNIDSGLGISAHEAAKKITDKTRALIAVHMDGLAADLNNLSELCLKYGLHLIEDAAQALGGSHSGKRLGTFGKMGCFSLNENKIISCGEGGIVTTNDRTLFEKAFCIQDASAQFNPSKKDFFTQIKPFLGSSMRVSEIQGTIMRVQLKRLESILSDLRNRKSLYLNELKHVKSAEFIQGHCAKGDCATSIHLRFEDPTKSIKAAQFLQGKGIKIFPTTARPAHASWKWSHLLGSRADYSSAFYLDSISLLTQTLKMDIDLELSLEKTTEQAVLIRQTIENN